MTVTNLVDHDAETEERLVMDAAVFRGIRNAILPSLAMWALIIAGIRLGLWLLP